MKNRSIFIATYSSSKYPYIYTYLPIVAWQLELVQFNLQPETKHKICVALVD